MANKRIMKGVKGKNFKDIRHVAERVVELRGDFGLTQAELGVAIGVTGANMGQAEKKGGLALYHATVFFAENYSINPAWLLLKDNKGVGKLMAKSAKVIGNVERIKLEHQIATLSAKLSFFEIENKKLRKK